MCDQPVMDYWVKNCWKPNIKEEALLVLDVHKAQKTGDITDALTQCDTTPLYVPPGCTSIIQPLNVSYNAPSKKKVRVSSTQLFARLPGRIPEKKIHCW